MMSYSRWGTSVWYTFWSSNKETEKFFNLPTEKLKRSQIFEICDFPSYRLTYGELKDKGLFQVMTDIENFYSIKYDNTDYEIELSPKNPTDDELYELMGYILKWEDEMDNHFKVKNFIMDEWVYPIIWNLKKLFL